MHRRFLFLAFALLHGAGFVAAQGPGPSGVHLGIPTGDTSTTLSVVWLADEPRGDSAVTLVGPDGTQATRGEPVAGPGPGVTYEARLTGLAPGADYAYEVGGRSFRFRTPPPLLDGPGASFSFAALGDMGVTERTPSTVDLVQSLAPDFVLHPGDISYAEGDAETWAAWLKAVEPVAATVPWITALGNHETYPDGSEIALYKRHFSLPGNEIWYSFDWAGVHFVCLDTYSWGHAVPDEEVRWLEADLQANAEAPWTVAFLHETPYTSGRHGESDLVQETFVPLFEAYGVDVVVAAHEHGYERTYPLLAGEAASLNATGYVEGEGVIYVTTGGGGRSLYDAWRDPAPPWSAARASVYHVVEFKVTPQSLEGRVIPTFGDPFLDVFRIDKPASPEEPGPGTGEIVAGTDEPQPPPPGGPVESDAARLVPGPGLLLSLTAALATAFILRGRQAL